MMFYTSSMVRMSATSSLRRSGYMLGHLMGRCMVRRRGVVIMMNTLSSIMVMVVVVVVVGVVRWMMGQSSCRG